MFNLRKQISIAISAILLSNVLIAGDVPFSKGKFKGKEKEFDEAFKDYEKGLKKFRESPPAYDEALPLLNKAQTFNPDNADLNCKIGICLLNSGEKYKALPYFEKAYELKETVNTKIWFYLGNAYQVNNEIKTATEFYNKYYALVTKNKNDRETNITKRKLIECALGDSMMMNPARVKVVNLGPNVNTKYPEYSPRITADQSQIFFTSRRQDTYGGQKDKAGSYYEDIYTSEFKNGEWQPAKNLGSDLNSKTHDATAGLSADGQKLFVFKGDVGHGDILMATKGKRGWGNPKSPGKTINTDFHESSASLSSDGQTLFFVSNRDGGAGGRDIYFSKWDRKKKEWGVPANIGAPINTSADEEGVWIHPDGKTLYFSSRGEGTMGGFDIFYSHKEDGKWTKPVNIGYPINSADDDVFMEMSADGQTIYFTSIKKDGFGDKDIYAATYLPDEKKQKVKVSLFKGHVFDADTKQPIEASLELVDLSQNEPVGTFGTDANSGKFLVTLPGGRNYGAVFQADGYMFESDNFNISDTADYNEYAKDVYLKPVKVGTSIVLNNIFFETAKWDLKKESTDELQRLVGFMTSNPKMKIEISGHTDNVGKDEYNQKLSENRSKSVADYIISKGILTDRVVFKGYGEANPVATNDTPEGRTLNRRTEFMILDNK